MDTTTEKPIEPIPEPPKPESRPAGGSVSTPQNLRGDLIGKTTNDISPNCPKAKNREEQGDCGVCLILPGKIGNQKQVQCEFCGQIFASKQPA